MYNPMARSATEVLFGPFAILVLVLFPPGCEALENPKFSQPIQNYTIAVGREAILSCVVENLIPYKVAWLRVDTQTILTIHSHVITKNHRIGVTHSEQKTWYLHIKEVKESDKGWYMCQINTDPMKSQVGYLDVVVPPDILDTRTSPDIIADEGSNVNLRCIARGSPKPIITWKREDGQHIPTGPEQYVSTSNGPYLNISKVKREHMGPYLCIASNGIPPSISKRIMLVVQFPPTIWIQYQLVGAYDGQEILLECHCEAFPKSINYWTRDKGEIIPHSNKYVPEIIEDGYRVHMKLSIKYLELQDFGIYRCISKNSMGEMEGTINVYKIPDPNNANLKLERAKSSLNGENEVKYEMGPSDRDRAADLLFREDAYYNCARQTAVSTLLICLRVLPFLANFL